MSVWCNTLPRNTPRPWNWLWKWYRYIIQLIIIRTSWTHSSILCCLQPRRKFYLGILMLIFEKWESNFQIAKKEKIQIHGFSHQSSNGHSSKAEVNWHNLKNLNNYAGDLSNSSIRAAFNHMWLLRLKLNTGWYH